MSKFNNDDWEFIPYPSSFPYETDFSRRYFSAGFGIGYERVLKNNVVLRSRVGITFRNLEETFFSDYHNQQDGGSDNYTYDVNYSYAQRHVNSFMGVAKRFPLVKDLSVDLGVELFYTHYFSAVSVTHSYGEQYDYSNQLFETIDIVATYETAPVNLFGLGPLLNINYGLSDHLVLSAGFQTYFTCMKIDGVNSYHHRLTQTNQPVTEVEEIRNYKVTQAGWSVISPLVSIAYQFSREDHRDDSRPSME